MTLPRLHRVRSQWVAGIAWVPLAPEQRAEHPGMGMLLYRIKESRDTYAALVRSQIYAAMRRRNTSVGRMLNNHVLRGKAPSTKVKE